jgi:hypothetical protein
MWIEVNEVLAAAIGRLSELRSRLTFQALGVKVADRRLRGSHADGQLLHRAESDPI